MARTNTLGNFLTDVADAIRTKTGSQDLIQASNFDTAISNIPSGSGGFTGHYDAEGLAQIGWTSEDIQYYQDNAVVWNTSDDNDYKLTTQELSKSAGTYTRFMPKDTTVTSFRNYYSLMALPVINISSSNIERMFQACNSLITVPLLNTSNVTTMANTFRECYRLLTIPQLNTASVTNMNNMFYFCSSLHSIPQLNTANVTNMSGMFMFCYSLSTLPELDTSKVTNFTNMLNGCYSLSDNSLYNILEMCINATSYTGTKTLSSLALDTTRYSNRISNLSNYQDFLNAGWTIS